MTVKTSTPPVHRSPSTPRLPEMGENQAPGWHFIRHSVAIIISILCIVFGVVLIGSAFVNVRIGVDGDGVIEPAGLWTVRPLDEGILEEVLVRTGDTVSAGAAVARLDTLTAAAHVRDLTAELAALPTTRSARDYPDDKPSAIAGDAVRTWKSGQAVEDVARLQNSLAFARAHLSRQTLRAPATGIVVSDQPGALVGSNLAPGQALLEIADMNHWDAVLRVTERDINRIRVGDRVNLDVPALSPSEGRVEGSVASIGIQKAGVTGSVAPTALGAGYRVTVRIDGRGIDGLPQGALRPGYAVHGKIVTSSVRAIRMLRDAVGSRARGLSR